MNNTNETQEKALPEMLTIRQAAKRGNLTENALRNLVNAGKIPCVKSGNRSLINYDKLVEFLNNL